MLLPLVPAQPEELFFAPASALSRDTDRHFFLFSCRLACPLSSESESEEESEDEEDDDDELEDDDEEHEELSE